jgi:hypothetical protein
MEVLGGDCVAVMQATESRQRDNLAPLLLMACLDIEPEHKMNEIGLANHDTLLRLK